MRVELRPARPADARPLHELHSAAVRALCAPCYAPEIIDGWLAGRTSDGYLAPIKRGAIVVAEHDRRVIGFAEANRGAVVAVYVHPAFARRGAGSMLLRHALAVAGDEHAGAIKIEATLNAVGFYERHGFRPIGPATTRRNSVDVPIVVMQRF